MSIQPVVKRVERFIVTGFDARTRNSDEFNEKTAKIPGLWQQFYTSELASNPNVFGVYSSYESDADGGYTITVGVPAEQAQHQSHVVTIEAGHYLVFQGTGPMPVTVIETWKRVWEFFAIQTEYRRNFVSDFEAYSGPDQVAIYIGLQQD